MTSITIGLLLRDNRIALEDYICDYFLDKLPEEGTHPWIKAMTIRHLLTMSTAHASTTYKRYDGDDWVKSFFVVEPDYPPGTKFSYDTSSSHVLAALVERVSKMDEVFITELFFESLCHFLYWLITSINKQRLYNCIYSQK